MRHPCMEVESKNGIPEKQPARIASCDLWALTSYMYHYAEQRVAYNMSTSSAVVNIRTRSSVRSSNYSYQPGTINA